MTTPFSSLFELQGRGSEEHPNVVDEIGMPRHQRPMVPSARAFEVDEKVNQHARNNETKVLAAATYCHCGCHIAENSSAGTVSRPLRVENYRCHVNYLQEIWTCQEGHRVLPEEDAEVRDGLIWISKDTAFTEVFLFNMLLQMVLGGTTIGCQAEIRSQLLFLQTEYTRREDTPRSHQTVRKALTLYAMSVVKGIEDWVFRCENCATRRRDGVYYDKLSFDGQQIGFKIRSDIRFDFYGKKAECWRIGVERCSSAWKTSHLIESHTLRTVIRETLRVRQVPPGCNSVHTLCRVMMNIPMHTKESVRAGAAAIKLFDENWTAYVPVSVRHADEDTFETFQSTHKPELASHPFDFITGANSRPDFDRGKKIMAVFRHVIDGRKAAAILAIMLTNLRQDLKRHIPAHDIAFLDMYGPYSYNLLDEWLLSMSQRDSWALIQPPLCAEDFEDGTNSGIAEHATYRKHPYRVPWSWTTRTASPEGPSGEEVHVSENMICRVRDVGDLRCPDEAASRILLMVMALLNEPVSVWMRDGNFDEFSAAIEILRNAERFSGQPDTSFHYRASLFQLQGCVLIYEGIMGMIRANVSAAHVMHSVLRDLLLCVPMKYQCYKMVMGESVGRNPSKFSSTQFDNMLVWTGAVSDRSDEDGRDTMKSDFMKAKYERIASHQSDDFLKTGVWAPDFPIRRPSPSTTVWGGENSLAERACSKNMMYTMLSRRKRLGGIASVHMRKPYS